MGIYIKGMEMPKGIEMLVVFSDGTVHKCLPGMREYVEKGTAVPLLLHGRLIDADALYPVYADLLDGGDVKAVVPKSVIDTSPTIIPAEEAAAKDIDVPTTYVLYNDNEFKCDISNNCPIAAMKSENERLKKKVERLKKKIDSLQTEINQLKSDISWDLDARHGNIHGMW